MKYIQIKELASLFGVHVVAVAAIIIAFQVSPWIVWANVCLIVVELYANWYLRGVYAIKVFKRVKVGCYDVEEILDKEGTAEEINKILHTGTRISGNEFRPVWANVKLTALSLLSAGILIAMHFNFNDIDSHLPTGYWREVIVAAFAGVLCGACIVVSVRNLMLIDGETFTKNKK